MVKETIQRLCEECKNPYNAVVSEVKRGRGKLCSPHCKNQKIIRLNKERMKDPALKDKIAKARWAGHIYQTEEERLKKRKIISRRWAKKNKKYYHDHYLKHKTESDIRNREYYFAKKYGMTLTDKIEMVADQNSLCGICEQPITVKKSHIDHDHKTEKIRGLLCSNCNLALGLFKDNIDILKKAVVYLQK